MLRAQAAERCSRVPSLSLTPANPVLEWRAMTTPVQSLHHGFRAQFLDYTRLTDQLKAWAGAYPELCRLESIGKTPEGRELWLLVLGREPERVRPAVWV